MKKYKIYWLILATLGILACSEEHKIGKIPSLKSEYTLPQGQSPADDRIVELYNKYGTYILYDYTTADLHWLQVDPNSNTWKNYEYTVPDPLYAGNILDLLEENLFKFYPVEFLKKYLPYKIFLTSTLKYTDSETIINVRIVQRQMVVSNCSEQVKDISQEDKLAFKNELQKKLWANWHSLFTFPEEFYKVSDYSYAASTDPTDWNYARERGFIADSEGTEWSTIDPWPNPTLSERVDLDSYLNGMRTRTSEEWTEDLKYPLVKKKYDLLRNYFLENFNFDIQKIGDAKKLSE